MVPAGLGAWGCRMRLSSGWTRQTRRDDHPLCCKHRRLEDQDKVCREKDGVRFWLIPETGCTPPGRTGSTLIPFPSPALDTRSQRVQVFPSRINLVSCADFTALPANGCYHKALAI